MECVGLNQTLWLRDLQWEGKYVKCFHRLVIRRFSIQVKCWDTGKGVWFFFFIFSFQVTFTVGLICTDCIIREPVNLAREGRDCSKNNLWKRKHLCSWLVCNTLCFGVFCVLIVWMVLCIEFFNEGFYYYWEMSETWLGWPWRPLGS